MKLGPRYKLCKRLGSAIFEKCQTSRYSISEAKKKSGGAGGSGKRPKPLSDFGKQLLEKQKLRYTYGLTERQFRGYVDKAMTEANPADALYRMLESRLDNFVYRAGIANTRRFARQLVSHGHITVNGRKVMVPSFSVSKGDKISAREGSRGIGPFKTYTEKDAPSVPGWLSFDQKTLAGEMSARPDRAQASDVGADIGAVLEFYSR
jgi:small subunit ribosomal protein S4